MVRHGPGRPGGASGRTEGGDGGDNAKGIPEPRRRGFRGLDVYADEPLPPDAPIRQAPNTVLTPHLGYVTTETYRVFYGQASEDIEAYLRGELCREAA